MSHYYFRRFMLFLWSTMFGMSIVFSIYEPFNICRCVFMFIEAVFVVSFFFEEP